MGDRVILRLEDIVKTFPGVKALDGVKLDVKEGEVHALCGENGAGKSTLMKIIAGAQGYTSGHMYINDQEVVFHSTKEAEKMGITLVQEGEDYSSFYDTGCIIYQSVNEGTMIGEGTKIGVKVSLGLTEEEMPNVVGKSENAAIEAITRLVGDVAEIRYVHDADAKPSEVIKQEPEAGASITAKSRIILTISKGDEDTNVTVPNVVNDTLEDAKASLTAVGLTVGNVSYAASDKVAEGKVITQTVAANKSVPSGSVVNLVVSSGADTQENENNKPSSNTQTQGTKYFTINAPSGSEGSVYVRVVKEDADGVYPVVDTYRDASEFPYSVSVTGKGSGTVTCYIDNVQQWSQSVNFSG